MDKNVKILFGVLGGLLFIFICLVAFFGLTSTSTILGGTVAVIPIYGEIGYGSTSEYVNPDQVKELIREANDDSSISAIVLDINSPGGTPVASEEIMESIQNSKKPVVSWISDTGTSGAYLVASASDKIVASPSSWVGSIGVILDLTDLSEMYRQMGVNKYAIKAGKYKDMGADYRNLTTEERKMLQTMINEEYENFINITAKNRNLSTAYVKTIAEGKIYTGRQAKNIKLVDYLGSKDNAIETAAKLAGIGDSYSIISMRPSSTLDQILSSLSSKIGYAIGSGIGENSGNSSIKSSY
ncbi:signal peptide peptidase SppA [Methanobacterium alcaliphilum]|uniref:signal peptide peptidase SppA n=1 Tax=Methanobacterium alcaliphilum TaxID=392018 RepID=UPI002009E52A|nr:signal peptide peptidase SppA [Methanobacterium alcaliphilum]MCK9150864.1 signal peptide peptidase SppA [Methanobacterium alcaliphilum]